MNIIIFQLGLWRSCSLHLAGCKAIPNLQRFWERIKTVLRSVEMTRL